jgi:putative hydrolase of the HAD superfamily
MEEILAEKAEDLTFLIDTGFVNRVPREELREVLEVLNEKNLRMGIISNVLSRNQVAHDLSRYGVAEFFDTVILSAVFGKRKPHPEIFREACRRASVKPENVLFIGNSPSKDIDGAKGVGMGWTVLIEYEFTPRHDTGSEPDYRIGNLRELVPIVEGILSGKDGGKNTQNLPRASRIFV